MTSPDAEHMSDKTQQEEPTMEEILASIRRIIADDSEAPAQHDETVLELTERVDEHGDPLDAPSRAEPELPPRRRPPAEELPPEPVFEMPPPARPSVISREPDPVPVPPVPPVLREPVVPISAQSDADDIAYDEEPERLLSEATESASTRAFAEIANFTRARREMLMGNGERTLEELTRELLRPLLKDWLDQNLPALVQRLVKEEIERMVRQGAA